MQEKNKSTRPTPGRSKSTPISSKPSPGIWCVSSTRGPRHSPRSPSAPARTGKVLTAWPRRPARRRSRSARSRAIGWPSPSKFAAAQSELFKSYADLWGRSFRRFLGEEVEPVVEPEPGDNRFKDPDWSNGQFFDFWKQAYLITSRWAEDLTRNTEGVDEKTRKKALFYLNQMLSAVSPSNFPLTNPEVIRTTLATNAENLVQGMTHFVEDLEQSKDLLRISQTDLSAFEIGRNLAVTPGKVVFQNDLIQLIQYAPTTDEVYERPLLVVPPWINKYYILDLVPEKSFVKWAVEQGFTVFLVSWVNPDAKLAQKTFEDYMREGILAAVDAVIRQTGSPKINALGYCVGGTLLASTLAYMAAKGDNRIASASFLAAQVDFSEAGDLLVFIDDAQLKSLEEMMAEQGYLDGSRMAAVFNMLRPRDLIWPYVINNYLLGKKPFPFDLLFWNADSTRLPAANHAFYLREFYHLNRLAKGEMQLGGVRLDLVAGEHPDLRAVHQGGPHRAGGVGVPRQQAVRRTGAPRHGGVGPYRRRGQSARQEEISVLVRRNDPSSLARVDGDGDRERRARGGPIGPAGLPPIRAPRCRRAIPRPVRCGRSRMRQALS